MAEGMDWPELNENGDLPEGIHRAPLAQVLARFGWRTRRRRMIGQRLERIYSLAAKTGHLARFIVFGSFVTAKPEPGDVDVFMIMDDSFEVDQVPREEKGIFDHMVAHNYEGASVFWLRRAAALGGEQAAIEHWQIKRDGTKRGIVEVIDHDQE